jgi:MFS transporter, FSR family, fosmidomycin resistance protein
MAQASLSTTESALENQQMGALQFGVVAICTLIQMCDGYDVGSIGWAVPSLTHAWHLPAPAFSTAFVWSSVGVMVGALGSGPIGDRFGRKPVIWFSILGAFPFALMLPYANLFWTGILSVAIGLILASAFSAILVYAQDLLPGRVGTVAGMFFGFSFGLGGLGAAALGQIADWTSIETVYRLCSFLPLIGLLTAFLPNIERTRRRA